VKKKISRKRKFEPELKVDDILLKNRKLFLYGEISSLTIQPIVKSLIALNILNTEPIYLFINSPGGSVSDGFALVDTIKSLKTPVYTVIIGEACSMGGLISIVGDERLMTKNSFFMAHDMRGGIHGDYSGKVEYRADFIKKCWKMIEDHLKTYTKLTTQDLVILRNGELWLTPQECLNKSVIDRII